MIRLNMRRSAVKKQKAIVAWLCSAVYIAILAAILLYIVLRTDLRTRSYQNNIRDFSENWQTETVVYSDYTANITFEAWNGHGELMIEEDPETGDICVTPSVHTSRSGVLACRWEVGGLANDLTMTLPLYQGIQVRLDDPMLNWQIFREMHYPYRWEENFAIFGTERGGVWFRCGKQRQCKSSVAV